MLNFISYISKSRYCSEERIINHNQENERSKIKLEYKKKLVPQLQDCRFSTPITSPDREFINMFGKKRMIYDSKLTRQKDKNIDPKFSDLIPLSCNKKMKSNKEQNLLNQFQNISPYLQSHQYMNQRKNKISMGVSYMKFKNSRMNQERKQQIERKNESLDITKSKNKKIEEAHHRANNLNYHRPQYNEIDDRNNQVIEDNRARLQDKQGRQKLNANKLQQILSKIPECIRYKKYQKSKSNSQINVRVLKRNKGLVKGGKDATDISQNAKEQCQQMDYD